MRRFGGLDRFIALFGGHVGQPARTLLVKAGEGTVQQVVVGPEDPANTSFDMSAIVSSVVSSVMLDEPTAALAAAPVVAAPRQLILSLEQLEGARPATRRAPVGCVVITLVSLRPMRRSSALPFRTISQGQTAVSGRRTSLVAQSGGEIAAYRWP
jgi:hypothetical protein